MEIEAVLEMPTPYPSRSEMQGLLPRYVWRRDAGSLLHMPGSLLIPATLAGGFCGQQIPLTHRENSALGSVFCTVSVSSYESLRGYMELNR